MCGVIMLFSISVALGTEILVSHHVGSMNLKMADRQLMHSVKIGIVITSILAVNIPIWLGTAVFSIFTDDPEVFAYAKPIFYVSVVMEVGRILNIIIINSLRAVGDTRFPMYMAILSMWGVSVPVGCFAFSRSSLTWCRQRAVAVETIATTEEKNTAAPTMADRVI